MFYLTFEIDDILFPIQSLKLLTAACNPTVVTKTKKAENDRISRKNTQRRQR